MIIFMVEKIFYHLFCLTFSIYGETPRLNVNLMILLKLSFFFVNKNVCGRVGNENYVVLLNSPVWEMREFCNYFKFRIFQFSFDSRNSQNSQKILQKFLILISAF
jgi:hypothetical protein